MRAPTAGTTHLVCSTPGPVGRDQPARVAVVDAQRLPVEVERQQGEVVASELARQLGDPVVARRLQRLDLDVRTVRSAPTRASSSLTPHSRPLTATRSSPRRTRSAASRSSAASPRDRARVSSTVAVAVDRRRAGTPALVADAVTRAAAALLLIGMPCGPSPDRTPKTETSRSHGTVAPALPSTATPAASQVVRSRPRRLSALARRGRRRHRRRAARSGRVRMSGSFTAMCTSRAPMAIQATAKWVARKLKVHGYHCAELASPVTSWKIAAATRTRDRAALQRLQRQAAHVAEVEALEQLREDRPELDQQQRDSSRPAEHVQALRDAVHRDRSGREGQPARGVLGVVADQSGDEADAEADAEPDADAGGDLRARAAGT